MVRPLTVGNYLKVGNWSVFVLFGGCFVFGIIMRWEGQEPFSFRRHNESWIKKLLLSYSELRESE